MEAKAEAAATISDPSHDLAQKKQIVAEETKKIKLGSMLASQRAVDPKAVNQAKYELRQSQDSAPAFAPLSTSSPRNNCMDPKKLKFAKMEKGEFKRFLKKRGNPNEIDYNGK